MMKTYERYKPSGVDWLGDIPEHWEVKRIASISTKITNGYVGPTRGILVDDGVRYLQSLHIKNNQILFERKFFVSEEWSQEHSKSVLKENDLLIVQTGDIGQVTRVTKEFEGVNCHALIIVSPKQEQLYGKFLASFMNSNYGFHSLKAIQTGALHPHLNCGNIREIFVVVPPLPEQTAIAKYLDEKTAQLDKLIAGKRGLIALLKEERSGIINHAVTRGINPHAKLKPSGIDWLGEIPEHWIINKFNRVAFLQEGPGLRNWQFRDSGIKVICVTNITEHGINFNLLERYISEEEYYLTYKHFTVSKGDYLLASSGASWGKVAEYKSDEKVILNTSTIRLNTKDAGILKREYINLILRSPYVKEHLNLLLTGSCQPNFGPSHLNQLYVIYPPSTEEQTQIVQFIEAETNKIDATVAKIEKEIEYLREYRTALISEVVTGKIKVV
jgi:type I restriction enzyme S subunit